MKIQYKLLFLAAGATAMLSSCGNRDILGDLVDAGQEVPTAYWELGSTTAKAGESFSFQGKYNPPQGKQIAYSEVWYRVKRDQTAAATVKLAGAALSYTKTFASVDTMRSFQPIARFDHSLAEFDGYEYILRGEVPVSSTLAPVIWTDIETWDAERFDSYYPEGFKNEFCSEVVEFLTKDSVYYSSLRTVYINYPFTNQQFTDVNAKYKVSLPDNIDMSGDDFGASEKSDLWFSTTEADETKVIGYYYKKLDANSNTVICNVAKDDPAITTDDNNRLQYNGNYIYPVYDAAPWVFCRYDDDLGQIISTVRAQYMPAFKELLQSIAFEEWIFDSANKVYKVDFNRKYSLDVQFRVYDTDGEEGIANPSEVKEISIN